MPDWREILAIRRRKSFSLDASCGPAFAACVETGMLRVAVPMAQAAGKRSIRGALLSSNVILEVLVTPNSLRRFSEKRGTNPPFSMPRNELTFIAPLKIHGRLPLSLTLAATFEMETP